MTVLLLQNTQLLDASIDIVAGVVPGITRVVLKMTAQLDFHEKVVS